MNLPSDSEVLFEGKDLRAHALGRVVLMVWHQAPRRSTIDVFRTKVASHHDRYPDGVVLIVSAHGGAPDEDARTAFKDMVRAVEKSILGVVVLLGIRGLRGAVVRGAVAAAVKALGLPFAVKIQDAPGSVADQADRLLRQRRVDSPGTSAIERVLMALESSPALG